ncbi:hypothetical protein EI171_35690 [Bradyrhizobium sp. LCT2]|nr:hypothetical protein EI171_35690 [Bradyrhizobium sp. LCT2]
MGLLKTLFAYTTAQVYICTFPNDRRDPDQAGERHIHTRLPSRITSFIKNWDRPGRGLFFCVGTLEGGAKRNKENIVETIGLHADIDFKNVEGITGREEVVRKLATLMYPPTVIVFSGGGLHCYWLFKEALPTQGNIERIETALRRIAEIVAGDLAVCEVARVLRLPTSHNTKDGKWVEVEVICLEANRRYELDDLEEWLAEARPILARKQRMERSRVIDDLYDAFFEYGRQYGMMRIDVDERLENMMYEGSGDSSIHRTQLACSAAMLNAGKPIDEVVSILLSHTQRAAGAAGGSWNWRREERDLRYMCCDWLRKHPRIDAPDCELTEVKS